MDRLTAFFCRRPAADSRPDGDLLAAFLADRDADAFAELVRRHGPLVWGVCRRSLPDRADAEDAFQATFLVLVRRAARLTAAAAIGPWLHTVAAWTARNARRKNARRFARFTDLPDDVPAPQPSADAALDVDAVLRALPERCRAAILLCHLEGLTHREAADRLGCPEGTVSSLVSRGLARVRARFAGRDPAAVLAVAAIAVPAGVAAAAVQSAVAFQIASLTAAASPAVVELTRGVLRMFWLKKAGLAAVLLVGVGFAAGLSVRSSPHAVGQERTAAPKADAEAERLVQQLGDADFAKREAAAKKLRGLGARAIPALQAGTRDPRPEVTKRSQELLVVVRADRRDALVKDFDPKPDAKVDHPVWTRYVAITGDSQASRELFARIIANAKWLRTLDDAEADPKNAGHIYRVGIAEMFRDFHMDPAKSPPWPCDRPEEVAYLLLLGSHADPKPPAKLEGDEIVPQNLRNTDFLGRGIIRGEGQITHANGLTLGLEGKIRFFNGPAIVGAAGTDRVFARLFAAWLLVRPPTSEVVPPALRIAAMQRAPEILPFARRIAANNFTPKRDVPPHVTIAALWMVAQHGTRADLPLFERYFGTETNVAAVDKNRDDGARDYYRPAPLKETTQLRDAALGLALLLHGATPEDFGFVVRKDTFTLKEGRYTIPWSIQLHLGFEDDAARTAAFQKAKTWLAELKPKAAPKPDGLVRKFEGHTNVVGGVAYFPTGDRIVSSGYDASYRIWDATTGKELAERSTGTKESQVGGPVAISPDGKRIAARYFVADADTGKFRFGLEGHVAEISRIRYAADGNRILTASFDGTIRIRDTDTGTALRSIEAHMGRKLPPAPGSGFGLEPSLDRFEGRGVRDVAFSPDGTRIVSGGIDGMVRLWNADTGKELWSAKPSQDVLSVAFLPDGRRVFSGDAEGTIRIWSAADGKEVQKLTGHVGGVEALAISPDGRRLVSAGTDSTVRVWDMEKGTELRNFRGHTGPVRAVAVAPDGTTALTGGEDKTVRMWVMPVDE